MTVTRQCVIVFVPKIAVVFVAETPFVTAVHVAANVRLIVVVHVLET